VQASEDLVSLTETLLSRRCLDQLGLARRAGAIAFGATQVEAAIRAKPAQMLIEASDSAEEGREKLMGLHIGLWRAPPPAIACFTGEELGVALGRERVIHACLLQERLALALAAEIGRLAGFRTIVPDSWPDSWRSVSFGPSLGGLGGADAGPSEVQGRDGKDV
jgi:ribosomal protein L7Ae-like RNA K-turn-binding protein